MTYSAFSVLDAAALGFFLVCWLGFGPFANWLSRRRPSLVSVVRAFRQRWTEQICARDNHIADVMVLANLLRGALFFASTSILILGGLVALVGTAPKINEVISQIPFTGPSEIWLSEVKALILIVVYVYSFFKFTWSAWQYNVLAIIVGAAPAPGGGAETRARYANLAMRVAALAGDSYNHGIRAYYFSIALMAWFVHPALFLAATLAIALVIYRREFHSSTLAVLRSVDLGSPRPS